MQLKRNAILLFDAHLYGYNSRTLIHIAHPRLAHRAIALNHL